jgi:hypothetical protein
MIYAVGGVVYFLLLGYVWWWLCEPKKEKKAMYESLMLQNENSAKNKHKDMSCNKCQTCIFCLFGGAVNVKLDYRACKIYLNITFRDDTSACVSYSGGRWHRKW